MFFSGILSIYIYKNKLELPYSLIIDIHCKLDQFARFLPAKVPEFLFISSNWQETPWHTELFTNALPLFSMKLPWVLGYWEGKGLPGYFGGRSLKVKKLTSIMSFILRNIDDTSKSSKTCIYTNTYTDKFLQCPSISSSFSTPFDKKCLHKPTKYNFFCLPLPQKTKHQACNNCVASSSFYTKKGIPKRSSQVPDLFTN